MLVGDATRELTRCSKQAGLVVTGSRPVSAIESWFLGSVSSALARAACCPLVAVRPIKDDDGGRHLMVVGIDLTPAAQDVLRFAFVEADRHHWDLRVVLCARPGRFSTPRGGNASVFADSIAPAFAESLAGWRGDYPDVAVTTDVIIDQTVPALVRASRDAAVLVVGSRRHERRPYLRLGSVTQGRAPPRRLRCRDRPTGT